MNVLVIRDWQQSIQAAETPNHNDVADDGLTINPVRIIVRLDKCDFRLSLRMVSNAVAFGSLKCSDMLWMTITHLTGLSRAASTIHRNALNVGDETSSSTKSTISGISTESEEDRFIRWRQIDPFENATIRGLQKLYDPSLPRQSRSCNRVNSLHGCDVHGVG